MGSRAGGNSALELKHHVLNGRLAQAKKLLASTRISLEDCQDEDGNTALHWCAQGLQTDAETREVPDEEMLIFLLQNGAPKNRQNRIGETPLMGAVRMATLDPLRAEALISALLSKGHADPRRADVSGESPLMEAAAAGLEEVGRLLLEHRANPLAESSSGLTAAQLAQESGSEAFALLLRSPLAERTPERWRAMCSYRRSSSPLRHSPVEALARRSAWRRPWAGARSTCRGTGSGGARGRPSSSSRRCSASASGLASPATGAGQATPTRSTRPCTTSTEPVRASQAGPE
ncbi:unnamed protein product [Prorocentrum cordatum]|uniref:Uncharacterized protein n=1 Tax=Prorocentrum cordatum TaxID=2364126 RepID=A0ABN9RZI2_9DINO|nr:unnamed protein product [Polarella glacialis]CAK0824855.1 unnamed protein product [Polarella glacialis]